MEVLVMSTEFNDLGNGCRVFAANTPAAIINKALRRRGGRALVCILFSTCLFMVEQQYYLLQQIVI